jgi:AcrR family transcriptional regulator
VAAVGRREGVAAVGRRGRPGHDLSSVLTTSVAVFNARGYDGTSMDDLARRLGISKSAIYHHVPGKQALLALALDQALVGLESTVDEVIAMRGPGVDRP